MKERFFLLLGFLLALNSCSQTEVNELDYENGRYFLDGEPFSGEAVDYWDDTDELQQKKIIEDGYILENVQYNDHKIENRATFDEKGNSKYFERFDYDGFLEEKQYFSRRKEGEYFVHENLIEWFEKPCGKINRKKKIDVYYRTGEMDDFVLEKILYDNSYQVICN